MKSTHRARNDSINPVFHAIKRGLAAANIHYWDFSRLILTAPGFVRFYSIQRIPGAAVGPYPPALWIYPSKDHLDQFYVAYNEIANKAHFERILSKCMNWKVDVPGLWQPGQENEWDSHQYYIDQIKPKLFHIDNLQLAVIQAVEHFQNVIK